MNEENVIGFWTVFGFFVGLMTGFMTHDDPIAIFLTVILVNLFFYLMAHLSVAFFVRYAEFGKVRFDREEFDRKLDHFYDQLLQRESYIDTYSIESEETERDRVAKGKHP